MLTGNSKCIRSVLTPSMSTGDRPSVGETTIPMPYCIVSEGGKDSSTDVDCWKVDLYSWLKVRYPNKAGNALDDDGKDSKENKIL